MHYNDWKKENPYFGKHFSILGDSISTLEGHNPKGYKVFYQGEVCDRSGVVGREDTWWGKVIAFFGGELLVNNSWSGSRVTLMPGASEECLFPAAISAERTSGLHIDEVKPDVILVNMGVNDWANGVALRCEQSGFPHYGSFSKAYTEMLTRLRKNYPDSEIWCCTLSETSVAGNSAFCFPCAYGGIDMGAYNSVIRSAARDNGCALIDLNCYCLPYESMDGIHPTAEGMRMIGTLAIREMNRNAWESYLKCEEDDHDYIIAKEHTGCTQLVCKKCGKEKYELVMPVRHSFTEPKPVGWMKNTAMEYQTAPDYVWLDPERTRILFSDVLELYILDTEENVKIQKMQIEAGCERERCDLYLNDPKASRRHATFFLEDQSWFLRDNGSQNGTYLNGVKLRPMKKYELGINDVINFGEGTSGVVFYKTGDAIQPYTAAGGRPTGKLQFVSEQEPANGVIENRLIAGKYRILERITEWSAVKIYRAVNVDNHQICLMKAYGNGTAFPQVRDHILQEAHGLRSLDHPAIPKVYDIVEEADITWTVREYIPGETLNDILKKHGAQPVDQVLDWAKQLCDVLKYLHSQNPSHIYGDMKPSNVVLQSDGKIRLIDYGTMWNREKLGDTEPLIWGTKGFMAPEGYLGLASCDARSDIYGLGMTLHYLVTGIDPVKPPYVVKPIRMVNPKLPVQLEKIIQKCVEPNPDNRFQSIQELMDALEKYEKSNKRKGFFARLFHK